MYLRINCDVSMEKRKMERKSHCGPEVNLKEAGYTSWLTILKYYGII